MRQHWGGAGFVDSCPAPAPSRTVSSGVLAHTNTEQRVATATLKAHQKPLKPVLFFFFFPTALLLSGQKKKKKSSNGKKCVQKQAFSKIADVCYINVVLLVKAKQFCIISRWASAEQDDCTSVETFGKGFFCITFLTTINPQTACKQIYERFQSL